MIVRETRMPGTLLATIALLAMLASCGDAVDDGTGAGALTADDVKQLNEAAEMSDVGNRPPLPTNSLAQ